MWTDGPLCFQLGWERTRGNTQQPFRIGEFGNGGGNPVDLPPAFIHPQCKFVDSGLSLLDAQAIRNSAPPALSRRVVDFLHHSLPVPSTWRADIDADAVVFCDCGEGWQNPTGRRIADSRHSIETPTTCGSPQLADDPVKALYQVREILRLRQNCPPAARMSKGTDEEMSMLADTPFSRRFGQLKPVKLDLLTRRMRNHSDVSARRALAWFAVGTHLMPTQSPCESRIGAWVTEFSELVVER